MKKKVLTMLLAVVLSFGAFGLVACGNGANPDDDYNYYTSRYEEIAKQSELRIEPVQFAGVFAMATTQGNFLVYIDNEEGADAGARLAEINQLAIDWDVHIYHFNPDLSGGYASDDPQSTKNPVDISKQLKGLSVGSHVERVQKEMISILKRTGKDAVVQNKILVGIAGAQPDYSLPKGYYVKEVAETGDLASLGTQLHIFNADGKDLTMLQANVMRAKYPQYYPNSLLGSNWATTGSATTDMNLVISYKHKATIATEKDYAGAIRAIAVKKPSHGQYAEQLPDGSYVYGPKCYLTNGIDTFDFYNDYRFHIAGDFANRQNAYTEEKTDVFQTVANYGQFSWLLEHNDGDFAVFFGGPWCPNTQAIAKMTNDIAKEYGIKKIYLFDPRLDAGVESRMLTMAATWTDDAEDAYLADGDDGSVLTKQVGDKTYYAKYNVTVAKIYDNLLTRNHDASYLVKDATFLSPEEKTEYESLFYNANWLYANFIEEYLPSSEYESYWNHGTKLWMNRDGNDATGTDGYEASYTKMAVPGIMMFDGSAENERAHLVKLAEAEYHWENTSEDGNPEQIGWDTAVREVFEANRYAQYMPPAITGGNSADSNGDNESNNGNTSGGNSSNNDSGLTENTGGC